MSTLLFIKRCLWLLFAVLVQSLILNKINLFGYATPYVFIFFILTLKSDLSRNSLLLWGFFLGLAIDVFSDTLGINAAASTFLAFIQPSLVRFFVSYEKHEDFYPSSKSMGTGLFIKYVVVGTFIFTTLYFLIRTFSLCNLLSLLLKISLSSIITVLMIIAIELSFRKKK